MKRSASEETILAQLSGVYISAHQHRLIGGCSKGHGQGYAELRGIISRHFVGEAPYMLARDESVFTGASATRRIELGACTYISAEYQNFRCTHFSAC